MMKKFFTLALMLTTLLASSTVFALSIYYPTDGIYSIQPKFAPNKELSVQGHASNWGANVIIDNLSSGWQKWKIQRIPGTHFYSIVAVSSNLAIDVANAQASDGANIATWPFLEGRQNQFAFFDAGGSCYVIKANLDGNFVLDVERAEDRAGANVLSWGFHGGDNQLWRLVMIRRLPEFQAYNKRATQKVTAYVMPDLQARSGNEYVSAGDNVTVLREEGNAYLVRYPVSGGTKTRWVNKNEIFSGSTPNSGNVNVNHNPQGNVQIAESTQPNTLHVKGTAFDQDNPNGSIRLHVYVGGTPGSNVPQYEIRTNGSNHIFDDTRNIDGNYSGNQLVHIYALNDYDSGENVEIWKGYVNIKGNNLPPNNKLQELINKWDGQKWSDGYSRSKYAEKYLSSEAIQCKEFASYIFNILYGTGYVGGGSKSSNYYNWRLNNTPKNIYQVAEVPETTNSNQAKVAFQELFSKAQPGDFIQIKRGHGGAHSAIFVRRTNNGIQWFDANADDKNGIKLQTYSYDDLVAIKKNKKGELYQWNIAMSLYRAR